MITEEQLHSAMTKAGEEIEISAGAREAITNRILSTEAAVRPERVAVAAPWYRQRRFALAGGLALVLLAAGLTISLTRSPSNQVVTGALDHRAATSGGAFAESLPAIPRAAAGAAVGANGVAGAKQAVGTKGATSSGTPALIASSGHLSLSVAGTALDRDVTRLDQLASALGGYVSSTNLSHTSSPEQATLVVNVPASTFERAIASAESLGSERSLTTTANDVTGQYNDTAAQLQALAAVRTQLEQLLSRAGSISALLSVENQIESVQTQINELEDAQRSLESQVTYASLTIDLGVHKTTSKPPATKSGIARAWSDAVNGFLGGLRGLLEISGGVVFALLCALVLLVIVRGSRRRLLPALRRFLL